MKLSEIKQVLADRGLRPLRQFGQNFLHDTNLCSCLADAILAASAPGQLLVEIGPGLGALTRPLLERGCHILAIEKDRGLAAFLRESLGTNPNFELIEGDALDFIPPRPGFFPCVVGNLPYNISTPLIMNWLGLPEPPHDLFFMLQLEMAQRIDAKPGEPDYGAVSVLIQAEYDVSILRKLPASVFYPAPEVGSAFIQLKKKTDSILSLEDRPRFREMVKQGFSQRRKKLSNLLPVDDARRAGELAVSDWLQLYRNL